MLLPADLRADVPLPQGATLLNVTRSPAPDGEALVLSFERPAIKGDPLAELSAAFVARGWVQGVHSNVNQSGFSGLASFSKESRQAVVTVDQVTESMLSIEIVLLTPTTG